MWLRRLLHSPTQREDPVASSERTDLGRPAAAPLAGAAVRREAMPSRHSTRQDATRTATDADPSSEASDVDPTMLELQQLRDQGVITDDEVRLMLRVKMEREQEKAEVERRLEADQWR